jgi:hypothetical protein
LRPTAAQGAPETGEERQPEQRGSEQDRPRANQRTGRSRALETAARGNRPGRGLAHSPVAGRGHTNRRRSRVCTSRHVLCPRGATDRRPKPGPLTRPAIACGRERSHSGSSSRGPRDTHSFLAQGGRLLRHDFHTAVRNPCPLLRQRLRRHRGRGGRRRRSRLRRHGGSRRCSSSSNSRRRGRRRDQRRAGPRRKQGQRIDVALVPPGQANAEIDERLGQVARSARADDADRGALGDRLAALHGDRPQVLQRRGVTVTRLDGEGLAPTRDGPGERHDAADRSGDRRRGRCAEIDSAVLSGQVWMRRVERERAQHRAVDRPRPGQRAGHRTCQRDEEQDSQSPHDLLLCCQFCERPNRNKAASRCQYWLQGTVVEIVPGDACQPGDDLRRTSAG